MFLDYFALGGNNNAALNKKLYEVLNRVTPGQLKTRAGLVNDVNVINRLKHIEAPLLYIQATKDRVVLADSGAKMKHYLTHMEMVRVEGPHMILQVNPGSCAELIISHVLANR